MSPESDNLAARMLRVEESQAFAEHTADQMHAQVLALHQRVHDLVGRIQRLESRLGDVGELVQRLPPPAPPGTSNTGPSPISDEQ